MEDTLNGGKDASQFDFYKPRIKENANASRFARDSYTKKFVSNQNLIDKYEVSNSRFAFNPDLDTAEGLYNISQRVGLGDEATRILKSSGGEQNEFWSGGLVMDTMDTLSVLGYGVVGLAKGKTFKEGVLSRESFADEDSLGKYGWLGKVAGFALDIVSDPMTYVPVAGGFKVLAKLPGMAKTLELAKSKTVGELKKIKIGGQEVFQRDGGWSPLHFLGDKLVYGYAADPKFLDGYRKIIGQADNTKAEAENILRIFNTVDPEVAKKSMDFDDDGFRISKPWAQLERELSSEELAKIKPMYDLKQRLQQELVDVGYLSKDTADKHFDDYLLNEYDDYLDAKSSIPGKKGSGLGVNYRTRNTGLTKEDRMALSPVDDAGVVWGATLTKQLTLLRNAKMQKFIADNFAITDDVLGEFIAKGGDMSQLAKVPDAPNYKLQGGEFKLKQQISNLNKTLKSILKERRVAFKDNKEVLSRIDKIEKRLAQLRDATGDNLTDAFNGFKKELAESGIKLGPTKKQATSKGQQALAESLRKWINRGSKTDRLERDTISSADLLKEYMKTREGLALARAFNDPQAMYQWKNPQEFFDSVRYPDRKIILKDSSGITKELSDVQQNNLIAKSEKAAREVGALTQELDILSSTNLKLVEDVMNKVEDDFADALFEKRQLLDALNESKMGQLAGKYVPKPVWDMLKESLNPDKQVGEGIVLWFKKAKVIWNPSSYPRNAVSAMIQNWWKLGLGPWKVTTYIDAAKEMKTKGKFFKEMQELGFSEQSGLLGEMRNNYINKKLMGESIIDQLPTKFKSVEAFMKHADRMLTNSYGHVDNVAKVAAYKFLRQKGKSPEEALKLAYAATFNYSEVTPFVHQMRRAIWGVPFITFALKAAPLVGSTLINNPGRISVFGKARNALFQASGVEAEQEMEAMPDWMRDDSFMLRLPWKDGEGRSMYFDLTYIVPFGAIMTGEYLKNPIASNPVLQTVRELSQNKTFTGQKIFMESDDMERVLFDITTHISKKFLPPLAEENFLPKGYTEDGVRQWGGFNKNIQNEIQDRDLGAGERSVYQNIAKVLGANVNPFELDSQQRRMEWTRKQALQELLVQNGVLNEFTAPYIGEDSVLKTPEPIGDRDIQPIGR